MENIQKKEKKFVSLVVYLHDASSFLKYFLDMIIPVCEKNFEQGNTAAVCGEAVADAAGKRISNACAVASAVYTAGGAGDIVFGGSGQEGELV